MGGLIVKMGQSTLGLFRLFGLMLNGPNTHFTTLNIHPTTISINIKNCHINIYIKLQFFKEKIINEMNKKIVRITLLFYSWQPNTIQTLKKTSIQLFYGGFIFQLKWLGLIFIQIQSPLSLSLSLSLGNTKNQTKRGEPKSRS